MDCRQLEVLRRRERAIAEPLRQAQRATAAAHRGLDPAALAIHVVARDQEGACDGAIGAIGHPRLLTWTCVTTASGPSRDT